MHICWFITTAVQTHWCGPTIRCQCHLYPVYGRPTTIEQADFHVFCQPHDILIRLFKIHIQKMDHNSRWLISVDLPFLYFLGGEINTCGMKNAYYTLSTVFIFCFENADLPQMPMYILMLEILYTRTGWKCWCCSNMHEVADAYSGTHQHCWHRFNQ